MRGPADRSHGGPPTADGDRLIHVAALLLCAISARCMSTAEAFHATPAFGVAFARTMQRALSRGGLLVSFVVLAIGVGVAAATGASQFPASVYPPPVAAKPGAAFSACPNPAGLERFDATSGKLAERVAATYGHAGLAADLKHSDRSWWPQLRHFWRLAKGGRWLSFSTVRGSQLGGPKMVWSGVVRHYCGSRLVTDSLNVFVGRRKLLNCDCNGVNLILTDRRGRPLVYMVH